jgi:hypothetical protein
VKHQARSHDHEPGLLGSEEVCDAVEIDVEHLQVVGQLDDAQAADARRADRVVAEMAAGPAGQDRDRVTRPGDRRVDREVGERRARRPELGEPRAHHVGDEPGHRDFEHVERLEPCLVLVPGIAHARLVAQEGVMRRGAERGGDVASRVEQQRVLLDAALVGQHRVGGSPERGRGVGRQRGFDFGQTGQRAI